METLIFGIDYLGTLVFAISGAVVGLERRFDVFGVLILALATAIGGGTLRDVLIGSTPVGWLTNPHYLYLVLAGVLISYLLKDVAVRWKRGMFLFDTIGIALYTILGLQKTLDVGLSPTAAVLMGVVSAVFGGVTRDVMANRVPLIFRKEIYASACLAGALCFLALDALINESIAMLISIALVFVIRVLAVKRRWSLSLET
ncbi:trimeric intracellular cation channel family protein [Lewinella sp. W8]|uniref:trimeric intracellular cation channel family protein n=1 Tax=Lewinella sp. W8 TaxID=2528208 RepID=UPI001067FC15|nr:trimeric intracellular cation channel family protein [Lewinella sp. W8]MTB50128.1 trimeric intracellular cation channel family protein [Lewinella sp. W8]